MYWSNEFQENLVASVVDVGSILFAFSLGLHQFGFQVGLGYALFDAWVVIWQKKNITKFVKSFLRLRHES